jgi:hypothetical protein
MDPRSGMKKKFGYEINIPDNFSESLETDFIIDADSGEKNSESVINIPDLQHLLQRVQSNICNCIIVHSSLKTILYSTLYISGEAAGTMHLHSTVYCAFVRVPGVLF